MQDTENDKTLVQVQPCGERDQEAKRKDAGPAEQEFFCKRKTGEFCSRPGMTDHKGDADNEEKERSGRHRKPAPEPGRDIDWHDHKKIQIEDGMKKDHHEDRDPPGHINLRKPRHCIHVTR